MDYIKIVLILVVCFIEQLFSSSILWSHDLIPWQRNTNSGVNPVCVEIPANMSLCNGIGYKKMRLPNLLQHDSLNEVTQQAVSWIPLLNLGCHPDTQLFLCSLFAPVCLEHPIPPCRSLCQSVQTSCEKTMNVYGYSWPNIVKCDQFPVDNDMCIQAQSENKQKKVSSSSSSSSLTTTESELNLNEKKIRKNERKNKHKHKNEKTKKEKKTNSIINSNSKINVNINSNINKNNQTNNEEFEENENTEVINKKSHMKIVDKINKNKNEQTNNLLNEIINKYCTSRWTVKGRGLFNKINDSKFAYTFKLRNYRLLNGNLTQQRPLFKLTANKIENINFNEPNLNRERFFIIGNNLDVNFIAPFNWKNVHFRKALKMIKNGRVNCEKVSRNVQSKQTVSSKFPSNSTKIKLNKLIS